MKINIPQKIYTLYLKNKMDINYSLRWILGYTFPDYSKQLTFKMIDNLFVDYISVNIENDIINMINNKFNTDNLNSTITLLLYTSFLLGGGE